MTATKERYEVEWCSHLPRDANGDADLDAAKYQARDFATRAAAVRFARKILPQDAFGSVRVRPYTLERYESNYPGTYREYGEAEFVENP